jgi:hypothetical protein
MNGRGDKSETEEMIDATRRMREDALAIALMNAAVRLLRDVPHPNGEQIRQAVELAGAVLYEARAWLDS